jgi:ubiquinone/menaquinone biosynthesis C-methylase UbiE
VPPNEQYNLSSPDSLPIRIAGKARQALYQRFIDDCSVESSDTILDVGVTSDQTYSSSNYLEAWYPHKDKITAVGLQDATFLEDMYPGLRFVEADGRDLPFEDDAFDVVHASAVLEHVGSTADQEAFICEVARVARRVAFITTPNRSFPIEFHTVLPLVHWLPNSLFRGLLKRTGYEFFADEGNLNLLYESDVNRICKRLKLKKYEVSSLKTFGWPSNILLTIHNS